MTLRLWIALATALCPIALARAQPMVGGAQPMVGGPAADAPKFALVVGVNDYTNRSEGLKPLDFAERDAHTLADLLKDQGYEVVLLTAKAAEESDDATLKPTSTNIEAKLDELLGKGVREGRAKKGHTVLITLSGHGFRLDKDPQNRDFFAPANAVPSLNKTNTLIAVNDVIERLERSPAAARMLLVDACRNTISAAGREVTTQKPGHNPTVADGVCVMFSCKGGQKSFEDADLKHGVFSHHVLGALSTYGEPVTWRAVSKRAAENVNKTSSKQGDQDPVDLTSTKTPDPVILRLKEPVRLVAPFSQSVAQDAQRVWAKHLKLGDEETIELSSDPGKKVPLQIVLVPPGEFTMGAAKKDGGQPGDTPHRVVLTRPYFIGRYEVTQRQMALILGKRQNAFAVGGQYAKDVDGLATDDFPADSVTFSEAEKFCAEMTKVLARQDGPLESYECRLPTEAEWEFACRAGTESRFYLGEQIKDGQANCLTEKVTLRRPDRFGQYPKNSFGLYDMHGNVQEWCSDWFASYGSGTETNPTGPPKATAKRVLRGGNYNFTPEDCRSASRESGPVVGVGRDRPIYGFRVVIAPKAK